MAPSKKSKKANSAPNKTTLNLLKALKKNNSVDSVPMKKQAESCPLDSSPKSVKKRPISKNLEKKLSKKRKRADRDKPVPCKQEGIKLLKRGAVTMHRIVRRKMLGIKHPVLFNAKGEPYGAAASEMQSYIGVLARTKAPICYPTWKNVPEERKIKIWDCVQMAFEVPPTAKKMVWKSAAQKWREFKCQLTTDYILPYSEQRELLQLPPADYSFIEKAHWDIFVASRLTEEFSEIHDKQKKRRALNKYPHRISRKGYANLEQEMSQGDPEVEIDRSDTWLKARQDAAGNYTSDELTKIAQEIENMKKQVSEGEVTEEGTDDVLTKVLGKPEHQGRVRGQGTHVKQSVYFNLPRKKGKRKSIEDRIQEGVQKFMAEETSRIVQERDAFWVGELAKLKATFAGKDIGVETSPKIGSQQGSCSKDERAAAIKEAELDGVKKKLNLNEDKVEEKVHVEDEKHFDKADVEVVDVCNKPEKENLEWELAIGSPRNVVAYATVDLIAKEVHGKPLGKENVRVSITRAVQKSAKIPFPVGDEVLTVEQALGTYVAWPRNLLMEVKTSQATATAVPGKVKNGGKKLKYKKVKDCVQQPEYEIHMDAEYPLALKRLWNWAKDALTDGRTISFELCEEAFAAKSKQVVFLSDVYALCGGGEISGSIICMFVNLLEGYLIRHKMSNMVSFVDPSLIGALGCGTPVSRSRALSVRFKDAKPGQIFLLPYNHMNHWALTVVNPESQLVYHMDPLKRRIADDEWVEIVDNGIKLYKEDVKMFKNKKIMWENLAGVPLQNGTKDCGLFIMRYMKEISLDKEFKFATKWARRNNQTYSVEDINEIKIELAKYFMKNHVRD